MKKSLTSKRIISIILAVLMSFSGLLPATAAFAADGVVGYYDIELFYKESGTIVPTFAEDGESKYIEYMKEGQELELTWNPIDTELPNNYKIKWYSETPTLVDVTQEGVVKAFDSSKGAVIHTWIDNEVRSIPLVGNIIASAIEKVLFNDKVNVDTMDTEEIVTIVEDLFGSDSILAQYIESYKGELIDSLRYYLDNINSNIHVQLIASDGTVLDDDFVNVCVLKNDEWYANVLPNGTHITNKSQINTTVAKGSTVQLQAVTTPVRLKYGVVYSVKSSSVFDQGKVVATVNDSGLVTFKNTGKVTIMVSPDTEQVIQGILKLVNYFYQLDNTGTINTDKIAGILIDYVGIDMNRTVLAAILDVCFAIKDIAQDAADPVQLTATAVEILGNLILQFVYNDTITFDVVEAKPLTDFRIEGPEKVQEGAQIQLTVTDIQPEIGDTSDITWESSDTNVASVDPKTGIVTGRDAGGSLGNLSSQKCIIYATSAANNVKKQFEITITGKTGKYLSDVEITGDSYLEMGEETDFTYSVFPKRVAESDNLYITWGILTGEDEEGNPTYSWADAENPATDGIGQIDSRGHYVVLDGGKCTIVVKAMTGYWVSADRFYEISSYIGKLDVTNGIPIDDIVVTVTGKTGDATASLKSIKTVTINGEVTTYATVHAGGAYNGAGAKLTAAITPDNASNKNLKWVVDNTNYQGTVSEDSHDIAVKQKPAHESADTFNVYATSEDGRVKSNVVTVCVTKNYVTSNTIDQESISIDKGKTAQATHSITFDGSNGTYGACYKCNWYSSDESVFTVEPQNNSNRDAVLTAVDVGTATLTCVSADGGFIDTCEVTVYPDKERLEKIVDLCDKTIVRRTSENKDLYKDYMKKLDLAYYVLYDEPMSSQTTCDTYAEELLYSFYKVGGFIGISEVEILSKDNQPLDSKHITVKVGAATNYTKYSYDLGYKLKPAKAMYSNIEWTSSNDGIIVDKNGRCTPASNDPCSAMITCTVTDYLGTKTTDTVFLTFARVLATSISLDTTNISEGLVGESRQITATVRPTGTVGIGASCRDVYWESSNEAVATVDQTGKVTFVAGGDCVIYATSYDGGYKASCQVNVVTNYTALELLVAQYNDLSLNEVNYYPDSWAVYTAAMTKAQKMLDARNSSQSQVDAMVVELEKAYNSLEKYNYIQKVELYLDGEQTQEFYQYDLSLLKEGIKYQNAVLDLNIRLYPNNGSYEKVEWTSSTSDISVTSDGKCSPTVNKSCYGSITCTVTDHFGIEYSDSVWVSFARYPVTELRLSQDTLSGNIGTDYQLTCTVYPTGTSMTHIGAASIQDYYWESDDESVATVDQTGKVNFVDAGSTVVRAVSYDGGVSAECIVSCAGDRSQLKKALDDYKDVDYTQYEYSYGMKFVRAYENGEAIMNNVSVSQEEIDLAVDELVFAYRNMIERPFVKVENIYVTYATYKKATSVSNPTTVATGTVSTNDALSVNLSSGYTGMNNYNGVTLTPTAYPSNAMYKSVAWTVDSQHQMNSTISEDGKITLSPSKNDGAWAIVTVKYTDQYDREYTRTLSVVLADNTVKSFDIASTSETMYATASSKQLDYTIDGGVFQTINWSSTDENVVKVNQSGVITPVDKGTAYVTGKTLDGGKIDSVKITVITDFQTLATRQLQYANLIENVKDKYTYTQESLDALAVVVAEAKTMVNEQKATQAEVNEMLARLDEAYNSLVEYIPTTGIAIQLEEDTNVSVVNEGFIRYYNTLSINGKTVNLIPNIYPANSVYAEMTWTSSNPDITVNENGTVTNTKATAGATLITCTVKNVRNESFSASVYVSFVRAAATGVSFEQDRVFGAPSQVVKLNPIIQNDANSTTSVTLVKDCIYSSSDESIATVNEKGEVTFISQGEATITAITMDGGFVGTIKAYTTWDTSSLKAAIDVAENITYTDYAYAYGTAFKAAYDEAVVVYNNVYASQTEIDDACTALTEATTALDGHPYIQPVITLASNGEILTNSSYVGTDSTGKGEIYVSVNKNAELKSLTITPSAQVGLTTSVQSNIITINKTATTGTMAVTVIATDMYDRETTATYTFTVIDTPIPATAITLTADGQEVGESVAISCGGSYTGFKGVTIGYIPTPADANSITSVEYTSSNALRLKVNPTTGLVELTNLAKTQATNTATITCTVTNLDGTTASASVVVTVTKA